MLAYSKGDLGVGVYMGGQKGEGKGETEEVRSGEVVAYKKKIRCMLHTHTHTHTHKHTLFIWLL